MANCKTGKRKHSELDAKLAVSEVERIEVQHRRRKYRETSQRFYQCEFCGAYHLTSQAKKVTA